MVEKVLTEKINSDLPERLNTQARNVALNLMVAAEYSDLPFPTLFRSMRSTLIDSIEDLTDSDWESGTELAEFVLADLKYVDAYVQAVSPRWKIERMALVDRNILRLGAFEVLRFNYASQRRVIMEYVNLGNVFGEQHTHAFVNGLLDELCKSNGLYAKA